MDVQSGDVSPLMGETHRALLDEGVRLFNEGKYWESHEAWETIWREIEGAPKLFLQGMIQAAAAYHLFFTRPRYSGAAKNVRKSLAKLDRFPSIVWGLDVEGCRRGLRLLLVRIDRARPDTVDEETPIERPRIVASGP